MGGFSIPVTADLSINIQKFHSIIFLSAFHLAALCVLCSQTRNLASQILTSTQNCPQACGLN